MALISVALGSHIRGMWRTHRTKQRDAQQSADWANQVEHGQERLAAALTEVTAYLQEEFVPASIMINPLLCAWDAAHMIDVDVAVPLEGLLTALVHRTAAQRGEVLEVLDEVRARALSMTVFGPAHALSVR